MKNKTLQKILLISAALILIAIIVGIAFTGHKGKSVTKIGLILTGSIEDTGWNGVHYQGVSSACKKLDATLFVEENVPETEEACEKAINNLIKKGCSMIILSSYNYPAKSIDIINNHPDVAFYTSSSEYDIDNLTTYFGRMYQARYLAGILAGMKTENNNIGYVAAMPNAEVIRGINAFTLGVKKSNPDATVNVIWTNSWDDAKAEETATNTLISEKNIDIVTYHQNQSNVAKAADKAGIYSIGYNQAVKGLSDKHLTSTVWNWEKLYYKIIREYVMGDANTVKRHWFGIDTGVIELTEYSSLVTEEEKIAIEQAKSELFAGKNIFSGKIYDNTDTLRCNDGESISDEILLKYLDWYVDGVKIYE